jgi:hypothetical protein
VVVFDDDPGGKGVIFDLARPDRLIADIRAHLDGASPSAPCRTVAVTGMPGAGVTSIAVHLASIWGRGSETCFVDLDRSWSCAPRLALGDEVVTWAMRSKRLDGAGSLSIPLAPGVRALVAPLGDSSVLAATVVKRQPRDPNGSCWTCRTGIGSRRSPLRSIR